MRMYRDGPKGPYEIRTRKVENGYIVSFDNELGDRKVFADIEGVIKFMRETWAPE